MMLAIVADDEDGEGVLLSAMEMVGCYCRGRQEGAVCCFLRVGWLKSSCVRVFLIYKLLISPHRSSYFPANFS